MFLMFCRRLRSVDANRGVQRQRPQFEGICDNLVLCVFRSSCGSKVDGILDLIKEDFDWL
jgi:hypothetical protein